MFASRELEEPHVPRQVVSLPSLVDHQAETPQQESSSKASVLQRGGDGSWDASGKSECLKPMISSKFTSDLP